MKNLGIDLNEKELDSAFERFKKVADKKKQVFDEDLLAIVEDEVRAVQKIWALVGLTAVSGTNRKPQVDVILKSKGKKYESSSSGDGPIDACYKAIDAVTKTKGELLDYSIQSVTHGKDALGEVTIKVKIKDKSVIAHGASTDIVEASAKAYLNAINKVLSAT
jgi:2-isopropylmalate synthase